MTLLLKQRIGDHGSEAGRHPCEVGLKSELLQEAYCSHAARARYTALLTALAQLRAGIRLRAAGFPQEATFRLRCAIAEFCEPAGFAGDNVSNNNVSLDRNLHAKKPVSKEVGSDRRAAVCRILDRNLYFDPDRFGLPSLVPQCAEIDEVFSAYAQLATVSNAMLMHQGSAVTLSIVIVR